MCPILMEPMTPVMIADGSVYEYEPIKKWLTTSQRSPCTNLVLQDPKMFSLRPLQRIIEHFLATCKPSLPRNLGRAMTDVTSLKSNAAHYWEKRQERLDALQSCIIDTVSYIEEVQAELNRALELHKREQGDMLEAAVRIQKTFRGWQERGRIRLARTRLEQSVLQRVETYMKEICEGRAGSSDALAHLVGVCEEQMPSYLRSVSSWFLRQMVAFPHEDHLYAIAAELASEYTLFRKTLALQIERIFASERASVLVPTMPSKSDCKSRPFGYSSSSINECRHCESTCDFDGDAVCTVLANLCSRGLLPARALVEQVVLGTLLGHAEIEEYHLVCACNVINGVWDAVRRSAACSTATGRLLDVFRQLLEAKHPRHPDQSRYTPQLLGRMKYCLKLLLEGAPPTRCPASSSSALAASLPYRPETIGLGRVG